MCSPRKAGHYEGIVGSILPCGIKCPTSIHYWFTPPSFPPLSHPLESWSTKIHSISHDVSISSSTFNHHFWASAGCLIETEVEGRGRKETDQECAQSLYGVKKKLFHHFSQSLTEWLSISPYLRHFGWLGVIIPCSPEPPNFEKHWVLRC